MTVPVAMDTRPRKDMVMKNVKGQLLRREESYTEAAFEEDGAEHDDVVLNLRLKPASLHSKQSTIHTDNASPNSSPALQRNVRAWCDATGLPTTITIRFQDRVFHLHKFPLVSRSGYLDRMLKEAKEVTLPEDLPGGPAVFELVTNFCYGSTILMEPANITEFCCVADYLQMTEDYGRANLCERSELYLTQVALQSWDDTLVVLEHCERLAPYAQQLGIVRRCLDALAFMACMELLDPVARKLAMTGKLKGTDQWWIQDLVALPASLFVDLIVALRREGMQENHVGQVITAFTDRWIFELQGPEASVLVQKGSDKCWVLESGQSSPAPEPAVLIDAVVRLLPLERHVVPIGFLFTLLRRGLACALNDECRIRLETRIALQFETATLHDLLLPGKKEKESACVLRSEIESMERILKLFLMRFRGLDDARMADVTMVSGIANLWDEYLAQIAFDLGLTPARFTELVERIPAHMRPVHDHVYRAIHTYLKAHSSTTQEERLIICRTLKCQKLSSEACGHAVQNDLMPLRMIVQAMFMQQLQTRSVLNSHLESAEHSFRDDHQRSLLPPDSATSCYPSAGNSGRHGPPWPDHYSHDSFQSLQGSSFQVDNDLYIDEVMYAAVASHNNATKEISPKPPIKGTESRLRSLEAELSRMRKSLIRSSNDHEHEPPQARRHSSSVSISSSASHRSGHVNSMPKIVTLHDDVDPVPAAAPPRRYSLSAPINSASHQFNSSRSGQLSGTLPKMATLHEAAPPGVAMGYCGPGGSSGCMKAGNPPSGFLARALQKLKFRTSFGRSVKSTAKETHVSVEVKPGRTPMRSLPAIEPDHRPDRYVSGRTDSMPRVATGRVKGRHVRHNSIS